MKTSQNQKKFVKYQQLKNKINQWFLLNNDPGKLQKHMQLKILASSLKNIVKHSSPKIVLYLIVRLFSFIFLEDPKPHQIALSHQIKEQYREWVLTEYHHNRNVFQLFILYQIKLTSLFISQQFEDIEVDQKLNCQICVILFSCLLGVSVSQSTFQVLVKRYTGNRKIQIYSKKSLGTNIMPGKKSLFSIATKSRKCLQSQSKKMRTQKYIRYSNLSGQNVSALEKARRQFQKQQFQNELRENLRVDPLPELKKKKMKLNEYERLMNETLPSLHQTLETNCSEQKMNYKKQTTKYILSNQVSLSLKAACDQQFQFEIHSKKIKLNQTMHNFNRQKWEFQDKSQNLGYLATDMSMDNFAKSKMKVDQWVNLVKNLKRKVNKLKWKVTEPFERPSFVLQ